MRKKMIYFCLVLLLSVGSNGVIGAIEEAPEECPACVTSNCRSISGLYTRPDLPPGYSLVAQIPKGACRILVQQLKHTRNILALRSSNGSYILNGDWKFSNSRLVHGAGVTFTYRKQDASSLETITTGGPIDSAVDILVWYQQPNPGIKYGYSLPAEEPIQSHPAIGNGQVAHLEGNIMDTNAVSLRDEAQPTSASPHPHRRLRNRRKYVWKSTGVTACSKSCGGGYQQSVFQCTRELHHTPVSERRCAHLEKPTHYIHCNQHECPLQWGGHWGQCTGSCGQGVQHYLVQCIKETNGLTSVESDSLCAPPKPTASSRPCSLPACDESDNELHPDERMHKSFSDWIVGSWSACSVSCGTGTRTRSVTCPGGNCHHGKRPAHAEYCESGSCSTPGHHNAWLLSEWSQCSENCGTGTQNRHSVCNGRSGSDCAMETKPETSRQCSSEKECGGQWFTGPWNTCTDSCNGQSKQKRDVHCVIRLRGQPRLTNDMTCSSASKPETERPCDGTCPPRWFSGEWSECHDCPNGNQRREVKCMSVHGQYSNLCDMEAKPLVKRSCACPKIHEDRIKPASSQQDQPMTRGCVDLIQHCYQAVQARLCKYPYYTSHCCHSCQRAGQQDALE